MDFFNLSRKFQTARRLKEIVNVFLRHGFGNIIDQLHLGKYVPVLKRVRSYGYWPSLLKGPYSAERMRTAFEELGPSFIKLAQIISTRPDLVPTRYSEEFRKLQDNVPPFPAAKSRTIIAEEMGKPFDKVFASFDDTPIAAASIAQVHRATLLDGSEVIVKVQRPGIDETIKSDIEILFSIARLIESNFPDMRHFSPSGLVYEFQNTIKKELDFRKEVVNHATFAKNFAAFKGVHLPKVYAELSSRRILVMEIIRGERIDRVEKIAQMGVDTKQTARVLIDAYFKMMIEDGFFHGDPHPGNIFVMEDGSLAFMDFGIAGHVSEETKTILANFYMAFIEKDFDKLVDQHIELGLVPDDMDLETFRRDFKSDLWDFVEPLYGLKLKEIDFASYLSAVVRIIIKHKLKIPSELVLIDKTLIMLQSLCAKLDPEFDFVTASEHYIRKLMIERYNPKKAFERYMKSALEAGEFLRVLPRQMKRILRKIIRDEIVVKLTIKDLDKLIKDMDRSSNRISVSMIISAILVSSAIMHASEVGPTIYGMSLMGFVVFGFAAVLGIGLIISIFRSGRL